MLRRFAWVIAHSYLAVEKGLSRTAAVVIMLMMFLTTADVIGRYVFNSPVQAAYEVCAVMLVGIVYLGLADVQSVKRHVKVEVITSWMPQRTQLALDVFAYIIAIVIVALMTWRTGFAAWSAWITHDHTTGLIRIPLWPGKSLIPIGTGLLCLRLISDAIHDATHLLRGATK